MKLGFGLKIALVIVTTLCLFTIAETTLVHAESSSEMRILYLVADSEAEGFSNTVTSLGGKIQHFFPPTALIVTAEAVVHQSLLNATAVVHAFQGYVPGDLAAILSQTDQQAVAAWHAILDETSLPYGEHETAVDAAFFADDIPSIGAQASDPALYQQSEFLVGRVAVNVVLVESDGSLDPSLEDWTTEERQLVFQQIVRALNWWQAREPRANLEFVYDEHYSVPIPVSYEPISRPHTDERYWISQAMQTLGYVHSSYITSVRLYNQASRQRYETDWAFTIFVVDSSNDPDNYFADGLFAYAYIYGPFLVMTYGNNGYGPQNMAAVAAHEIGHIFGALDQYASSGCKPDRISGYLGVPNGNCQNGGITDVPCIMRGGIPPFQHNQISTFAAGQVGWRDSDSDGILDPVDTALTLDVDITASPEAVTISGMAVEEPYPSPTRQLININHLESAQYRVAGGDWQPLAAVDGAFDSYQELFSAELPPAAKGNWGIEIRAINTAGVVVTQNETLAVSEGPDPVHVTVEISSRQLSGQVLTLKGSASTSDDSVFLSRIEYQLDGSEWQPVTLGDGNCDSASEQFVITTNTLSTGNHTLSIRALAVPIWSVAGIRDELVTVESQPSELPPDTPPPDDPPTSGGTQEPEPGPGSTSTNYNYMPIVCR